MALDFVNDLIDQKGGSINKTASQMAELRKKVREVNKVVADADQYLSFMDTSAPIGLPTLPEISGKLSDIRQDVGGVVTGIADVSGVAGSCLDGALSTINGMSKDALSVVQAGLTDPTNGLGSIAGMPSEMLDLNGMFGSMKDSLTTLGLDKLIGQITASMGCMGDSSLISDVTNELNGITTALGLAPDGSVTSDAFGDMLAGKMSAAGFDMTPGTGYGDFLTNGLNDMAEQTTQMAEESKAVMKSSISAVKNSIPPLPAPPNLF